LLFLVTENELTRRSRLSVHKQNRGRPGMNHFDAIIIGAGQAGPSLAGKLTGAGLTVAYIERKLFGGTCVNTGCMPTKTLVASAYAVHLVRRVADYGIMLDGAFKVDMRRVKARADAVSSNARRGVENYLRDMKGCTVFKGHGRFEGPDTVSVGGERLTAPRIFIDVGGRAIVPDLPGIWALGECNGRGAFTHTAYNDFEIVAANLLAGVRRRLSDRISAHALYIDPPLGRVGMTEAQARASGRSLLMGRRPMSRVGRAVEKDETQGFMKVVVDAETRQILGAAILGTGGDEAIHRILDIMNAHVPYDILERAVPIHPTVSELVPTILSELRPV